MRLTRPGIGIDLEALYVLGSLVVLGLLFVVYKFAS